MDFGGLAVLIFGGDAFAKVFQTAHLRLNPASDVVSRPALTECPAVMPCSTEGLVSGSRDRAIFFPEQAVLADGDDCAGLPVDDSVVAAAGVITANSGHRADLFALGNLTEQFRQDRTVAVAAWG